MQVFHGTILTCDENNTVANYLVEREGRIAYIGTKLPTQYEVVPPIELGNNVLIPAFVDTHMHYSGFSVLHKMFPINDTDSNAKILEQLKEYASRTRENIIVGFGATEFSVSEGHLILKEQMDMACPEKPAFIIKHDAHSGVANSLFLDAIKSKVSNLRGYNADTGELKQEAFLAACEFITHGMSTKKVIDSMVETSDFLASKGIGLICSASGMGFIRDYDFDMERSVAKGLDNGMQVRVAYQCSNVDKIAKKDMTRVVFGNLDGTFANKDAALNDNYETINNKGVSYFSDAEVQNFCINANRAGYQIALHAVGDAAFEQAVNAISMALEDYPRYDHRHIILHGSLPTEKALKICAKYNIMISVKPSLLSHIDGVKEFVEGILSEDRAKGINPLKTITDMGIKVCFNSDAPASDPNPIMWIHDACNNANPEESVSIYDALKMATINGAISCFDEKERGTLEMGKSCDLAVLDKNPYEIPVDELKTINVSELYLKGKPYKRSRTGSMATMLRGMFPQ
ncbi:amidohydrolase family protein [Butyrivibrio fibrisolvens]|uniref:amidohydrolase n=1 Tax=Pseudobutyrivibrio ruminis TaxID=46206 RepID=UPI0003F93924|nr:amidohydrolase family protein [Pseudobutyrivibrio ruminis]MDC7279555.1 amidohydrolase family protein [Butyrivibrio fibrisolvens]